MKTAGLRFTQAKKKSDEYIEKIQTRYLGFDHVRARFLASDSDYRSDSTSIAHSCPHCTEAALVTCTALYGALLNECERAVVMERSIRNRGILVWRLESCRGLQNLVLLYKRATAL